MQKIVYILGAGFSKPLGLPIMSNFIDMAKDLYSKDTQKYAHFSNIFKIIHQELAWIKTVYNADLNNIEEIFSVLEMLRYLDTSREKDLFEYSQFLADVINYYTPTFALNPDLIKIASGSYEVSNLWGVDPETFKGYLWGGVLQKIYCGFVLGLFNANIELQRLESEHSNNFSVSFKLTENPYAEYSIITLNYDLVLENTAAYLSSITEQPLQFRLSIKDTANKFPVIAKLHGSVHTRNMIPPTWNKRIDERIEKDWQTAYGLLRSANHIRILGYSLPITDAYIRYLLKASILENDDLKSINVLCLDTWGTIKKRYDEFIELPPEKYQFSDINVTDYLASAADRVSRGLLMDDVE